MSQVNKTETSWDVLGYYLPLPAIFIYDDPMLSNPLWLEKVNNERNLSGTLYMVSSNDEGKSMYFFLFGMAFFYLPFFFLAHIYSILSGFPPDGFSLPYQYFLTFGAVLYTIVGFIFMRKILNRFFKENLTALLMILILFGTNSIHHLTIKNLETVNILFMLQSILIWKTIQWHDDKRLKHLLFIGFSITMMGLVKPTEAISVLIPILWNTGSYKDLKEKFKEIYKIRSQFIVVILLCIALASPQIIYWLIKTGKPVYDTYKNNGIGLDLFSPHIFDVLFSYRKGWLVYTPLMIFSLIGFYFIFRQNRKLFFGIGIYFIITFYIISSWTEWWYGAAFSMRPIVASSTILAIALGYFIETIKKISLSFRLPIYGIIVLFSVYNLFEYWQLQHYILDPYRTTKEYFYSIFLKTSVSEENKKLLLIERDFYGKMEFKDHSNFDSVIIINTNKQFKNRFQKDKMLDECLITDTNTTFYRTKTQQEFALSYRIPYNEITDYYYTWLKVSFDIRILNKMNDIAPFLVITMDRKNGNYKYFAPEIKLNKEDSTWQHFEYYYLSPELRSKKDDFLIYFWKKGKTPFDICNLKVEAFVEKKGKINKKLRKISKI